MNNKHLPIHTRSAIIRINVLVSDVNYYCGKISQNVEDNIGSLKEDLAVFAYFQIQRARDAMYSISAIQERVRLAFSEYECDRLEDIAKERCDQALYSLSSLQQELYKIQPQS